MQSNPPDIAALLAAAEAYVSLSSIMPADFIADAFDESHDLYVKLATPESFAALCKTITTQAEQIAWLHRRIATLSKRECRKAGASHAK